MITKNEQEILKAKIEAQMAEHYEKVFDGMFRWCIFDQESSLETAMQAFGIDPAKLTMEACEKVLNKYKGASNEPS